MRSANLLCAAALAAACNSAGDGAAPAARVTRAACQGTTPSDATARVFEGLRPGCEGCHASGTRGFFASLEAFQQLLVGDGRLVAPGRPDESELLRLLSGAGTGAFRQMPISGPPYAQLVSGAAASDPSAPPSMDELRAWIESLGAQTRDQRPAQDAPRVTRMSAQQIQRALYQQLGLAHGDFFGPAQDFGIATADVQGREDRYPMQGPDAFPMARQESPNERFLGLGGGSTVRQVRPDPSLPPTFVHTLTQVAQRWCRLALAKAGNRALLPEGASLSAEPAQALGTIKRWRLHFLAERSDDEDRRLYDTVFQPLAASAGAEPAYVAVCSYFIRHPHWIFY